MNIDRRPRYEIVWSSYLIGMELRTWIDPALRLQLNGELEHAKKKGCHKKDAKDGTRISISFSWTLFGAVKHLSTKYKQPTSKCQGALHASVRLVQSMM